MNRNFAKAQYSQLAAGAKTAAGAVVIALILLAGAGPVDLVPSGAEQTLSGTSSPSAATEYFPAGYRVDPTLEITPHIEAY